MHPNLVFLTVDENHALATWDRVLIQLWRGPVTQFAASNLRVQTRKFQDQSQVPICSLAIVEPTSPAPADELRRDLSSFYRENAQKMVKQVVVAEGGGFRAALVRGVGIALSTLAPQMLPFKFVSSVGEAATVLEPHLSSRAGRAKGLLNAIDVMRHHAREKAPLSSIGA